MQSAVTEDSESDGAGGNRERLALLPKAGGGHQQAEVIPINYGSDGEASPEKVLTSPWLASIATRETFVNI